MSRKRKTGAGLIRSQFRRFQHHGDDCPLKRSRGGGRLDDLEYPIN